jgi:diadenosine tetraphosphate (Ap4A) HIT family hydrolase
MSGAFCLDERLAASTHQVARWALSCVLLKDDANFPWLILVPERWNLTELHDLKPVDLETVTDEIVRASRALKAVFKPDKINIAALGNQVPQLHIHVIARFTDDPAWPRPVWDAVPPHAYEADQLSERVTALQTAFGRV